MSDHSNPSSSQRLAQRPFWFYFSNNKRPFVIGVIALLLTNILDVIPPFLIGIAIDQIADGKPSSDLVKTVGMIIGVTVLLAGMRYFWRINWGRFHHTVAEDLRNRIFSKFAVLGPSFYQKNPVGQLMSLINNDVNSFRMAIGPGVLILLDAAFIMCLIPPLMISISPDLTWKTLALMPLIPFVIAKIEKIVHDRYKEQQDKFAEMSGSSQEIIAGIRVIKSYAQETNQTKLFNVFNRNYENACNHSAKINSSFSPVLELGVTVGSVVLLFVGAPKVLAGTMTIGALFTFYQYIQRMVWPMTAIGIGVTFVQQGKASFTRVLDLLGTQTDIPDQGDFHADNFESLEIKNLTYTYPNAENPSLKNVSFELKSGETLGILGPTGSGKTTLVDLICRLFPTKDGEILINGKAVDSFTLESLRSLISLVPQEAFLFSQRISENIAMDSDPNMERVQEMSQLVNLDKEIDGIPEGYNAYLGERGVNLSGGQKQRMTLARALIRKTPLVILDDSLSAVDAKTEKKITSQLKGHIDRQQTTIIVSHRLASLNFADRILVLKEGEVEAIGRHDQLLESSEVYRETYDLQNSGKGGLA